MGRPCPVCFMSWEPSQPFRAIETWRMPHASDYSGHQPNRPSGDGGGGKRIGVCVKWGGYCL